jgi:hypothetical protein
MMGNEWQAAMEASAEPARRTGLIARGKRDALEGVNWRGTGEVKKMAPVTRGHFPLVIPVMMTPYDYRSVAIVSVPVAMDPAITPVKLGARAAIFITIIVSVASNPETETLCVCDCRRCNRDGR